MSRTKGYKCFNIECGSCIGKTLCGEPEDTALGCSGRVVGKPMTNADSIRAMSDEELAEFIPNWNFDACRWCDHYTACKDMAANNECEKCVLEWLQQPAEEDDHA